MDAEETKNKAKSSTETNKRRPSDSSDPSSSQDSKNIDQSSLGACSLECQKDEPNESDEEVAVTSMHMETQTGSRGKSTDKELMEGIKGLDEFKLENVDQKDIYEAALKKSLLSEVIVFPITSVYPESEGEDNEVRRKKIVFVLFRASLHYCSDKRHDHIINKGITDIAIGALMIWFLREYPKMRSPTEIEDTIKKMEKYDIHLFIPSGNFKVLLFELLFVFPTILYKNMKGFSSDEIKFPWSDHLTAKFPGLEVIWHNPGFLGLMTEGSNYGGLAKALVYAMYKLREDHGVQDMEFAVMLCRSIYNLSRFDLRLRRTWLKEANLSEDKCAAWSQIFDDEFEEFKHIHTYFGQNNVSANDRPLMKVDKTEDADEYKFLDDNTEKHFYLNARKFLFYQLPCDHIVSKEPNLDRFYFEMRLIIHLCMHQRPKITVREMILLGKLCNKYNIVGEKSRHAPDQTTVSNVILLFPLFCFYATQQNKSFRYPWSDALDKVFPGLNVIWHNPSMLSMLPPTRNFGGLAKALVYAIYIILGENKHIEVCLAVSRNIIGWRLQLQKHWESFYDNWMHELPEKNLAEWNDTFNRIFPEYKHIHKLYFQEE